MPNMNQKKNPMPEQAADIRNKNFEEVALGYSEETALAEAERCLQCSNKPCVSACPVNVRIPEFIKKVTEKNYEQAYEIIMDTNSLPAVCGRVCPQESQCESKCVRGIKHEPVAIGRLERFVADRHMAAGGIDIEKPLTNGRKVAIIGAGPSGLSCASDLAKKGYDITIYEAFHTAGGVLTYGIPQFRLPKEIVQKEIENLKDLGVSIVLNAVIGKSLDMDDLFEMGYKAVYIASGAGLPSFMGIEGENLLGVYSANEYLTRINFMKAWRDDYVTPIKKSRRIAVVGGGNVAMDAARCAKRMGADEVFLVYRRSEKEMPARLEEVHHAKEEGIILKTLTNPVKILSDESSRVNGMECVEMDLGEADASGRRSPIIKEGSNFVLPLDCVIMAIGTSPNPMVPSATKGLETNRRGCIVTDENLKTSLNGVYAGGDAVKGAATVIYAMGTGKTAARSIDEYISSL